MSVPMIDLRTVILLAGAMGALMAVVTWFMRRSYPRSIDGLGQWSAGQAIIFLSTLLFGTRGMLPELITVVAANLLLITGVTLLYLGSKRFFCVPAQPQRWTAAIATVTTVTAWFTFAQPNYNARLLAIAGFMAFVCGAHALLVARRGGGSFSARFVLVVLVVEVLVLVLRAVSALSGESADLLAASPIQTIYIAAYTVAMLMLSVGLVLLAADRLRDELEHIASHDPLTGVLNRRAILDACGQELERGRRKDRISSLLMLDLDHFKAINDSYGHQAGDRLLVDFVARVAAQLRRPDHFSRFGGEEFVALLPETTLDEAMLVAERIRAEIARGTGQPGCTVSIGVAATVPGEGGIDTLLGRADEALYRAKAAGRNCVQAMA